MQRTTSVYISLDNADRQWDKDAVRLPRFDSIEPEDLAAQLTEKQRSYGQPTHTAAPMPDTKA
jgi:hypothetical protein